MEKTVGTRELKTRLGTYLRWVRGGATLIVTKRGRPVAELRPISPSRDDLDAVLREMLALGEVSRSLDAPLEPFDPISVAGEPISRTLSRGREDRF